MGVWHDTPVVYDHRKRILVLGRHKVHAYGNDTAVIQIWQRGAELCMLLSTGQGKRYLLETWTAEGTRQVEPFAGLPPSHEFTSARPTAIDPLGGYLVLRDVDDPWLNTLTNRGTGFERRALTRKGQFVVYGLTIAKLNRKPVRLAPVSSVYRMTTDSSNYW